MVGGPDAGVRGYMMHRYSLAAARAVGLGAVVASSAVAAVGWPAAAGTGVRMGTRPTIAAGGVHSLVVDESRRLLAFGYNGHGQLGTSGVGGPAPVVAMTDVETAAAGAASSYAVRSDGSLWSFGLNGNGQLGRAVNSGIDVANPTPGMVMSGVVSVAAGDAHTLVLKADGTVWSFGDNRAGQLGRATANLGFAGDNPTPVEVMTDAAAVAAGATHSLVLKVDGTVWGFGSNTYGQLGASAGVLTHEPFVLPRKVMAGAVAIAAGGDSSMVLQRNGSLVTFGRNSFGQLGRPEGFDSGLGYNPANLPARAMTDVIAMSVSDHALVIQSSGEVLGFGRNDAGESGHANVGSDWQPKEVLFFGRAAAVSAGGNHSLVTDGSSDIVYSMGSNLFGQLGVGAAGPSGASQSTSTPFPTGIVALRPSEGGRTVTSGPSFAPLVPVRVLESRVGETPTADGRSSGIGPRMAGSTTELVVGGRAGVPVDAIAVYVNVTAVGPKAAGFVTVWPCGEAMPVASTLNVSTGATVANAAVARVGVDGKICLFTSVPMDLVVDLSGFYPLDSSLLPLVPERVLDSRADAPTIDGANAAIGLRAAGSVTEFALPKAAGVPDTASAVILNVTGVEAQAAGFVTVWPCTAARPVASNLNIESAGTVAGAVIEKFGSGARVCVYTSVPMHLVVDVNGYFPFDSTYVPLVPARVFESRASEAPTVDGVGSGIGLRQAGSVTPVRIAGRAGSAANAPAAVLNVTAVDARAAGFVTVWPCGESRPTASSLNVSPGGTAANAVVAKVGASGEVCFFTSVPMHLVVDLSGYFPSSS